MKVILSRLVILMIALSMCMSSSLAYDHEDTEITRADPKADITSVYAFLSQDPITANHPRTVFVMLLHPDAQPDTRFSSEVEYTFHIVAEPTPVSIATFDVITCRATADENQQIKCTGRITEAQTVFGQVNVGNPERDNLRLFAGLVDDPTFFDRDGFAEALTSPEDYQEWLSTEAKQDSFAGQKNLAIVLDILNSEFDAFTNNQNVKRMSFFASTTRLGIDR